MKKMMLIYGLLLAFQSAASNTKLISKEEYIATWSRVAMEKMMYHKIPASITLAQGILESGNGNSDLARLANNHFGIKCHDWTGDRMYKDDDAKNECFRKYSDASLSYEDHSKFLTGKQRYAALFTYQIDDYKSWAKGLKAAGYATNPKYPELLINLIESSELYKYDQLVLNSPSKDGNVLTKTEKSNSKTVDKVDKKEETTEKTVGQKIKSTISKTKSTNKNEVELVIGKTRETLLHDNKVKYVVAKKGDTYYKIAEEFGMTLNQLHKYNDVKKGNSKLTAGDVVNIHPKRGKGAVESKTYAQDLTILTISQLEGVKVESLMKLNGLSSPTDVVKKGQKVTLK
ncbi:MAG TPA: glucosaminidase domain-containing protein [Taishania sp.]|nr:glucosaminidase domain-containing protein [Taishania sp.]